jgi:hypothetical protein
MCGSFKHCRVILSEERSDESKSLPRAKPRGPLCLPDRLRVDILCRREERRANSDQRPFYSSLRPSIAFCMVTSSAYSISLPTGTPVAMRVTFTDADLNNRER